MRHLKFVVNCALVFSSIGAFAQDSARTVQYHSQDIVPIRAKVKYTTLIELPTTEKIMEAATGDKEFWVVDVVGNVRQVRPLWLQALDHLQRFVQAEVGRVRLVAQGVQDQHAQPL